jgi:hypothetical protein
MNGLKNSKQGRMYTVYDSNADDEDKELTQSVPNF